MGIRLGRGSSIVHSAVKVISVCEVSRETPGIGTVQCKTVAAVEPSSNPRFFFNLICKLFTSNTNCSKKVWLNLKLARVQGKLVACVLNNISVNYFFVNFLLTI